MTEFKVDTVIIGAGVVGLAIAWELSKRKKNVIVLETLDNYGKSNSSRNSGVIHSGIYYPEYSLKSKFCIEGNSLLYDYCEKYSIPYKKTKKLVVASSLDQIVEIDKIKAHAENIGINNIEKYSKSKVLKIEPLIRCEEALFVPSSGILDVTTFMSSLEGQIRDLGNMIAYKIYINQINFDGNLFTLNLRDSNNIETTIKSKEVINSAGLYATEVAKKIVQLNNKNIPNIFFGKGSYFSVSKDFGIRHLIYPIPNQFTLGIHLTLELDNTIKFGPDLEWVSKPDDFEVKLSRKKIFENAIKKYFPALDINLLQPSYSGIRPIANKDNKSMRDFIIDTHQENKIPNLINLYAIESPGLTSSLAIGKHISRNLN